MFQWSVQNVGKVKIKGVDIALHTILAEWKSIKVSTNFTYTFQQALDLTDSTQNAFRTQLPYTPKHSGSGTLGILFKQFAFNFNTFFSSLRYRAGDQIFENLLQPFSTTDVSLSYLIKNKKPVNYKIIFEANNVLNTQYQIIKYYPMPLFNYRLTVHFSLKNKTTYK